MSQPFLTHSWYVAASGHEIGRTPFARTLLNKLIGDLVAAEAAS